MLNLNAEKVRQLVSNNTYRKAIEIYTKSEVKIIRLDRERVDAEVFDLEWFSSTLFFEKEKTRFSCSCEKDMPCPHVTAVMLQSIRFVKENSTPFIDQEEDSEFSVSNEVIPPWKAFFQLATSHLEIKHPKDFVQKWIPVCLIKILKSEIFFSLRFLYIKRDGTPGRWQYLNRRSVREEKKIIIPAVENLISYFEKNGRKNEEEFVLSVGRIPGFVFDLLRKFPVYQEGKDFLNNRITIDDHLDTLIKFKLSRSGKKAVFKAFLYHDETLTVLDSSFTLLSDAPVYIYKDNTLYRIGNVENCRVLKPFIDGETHSIIFDINALNEFWRSFFPAFPYKDDVYVDESLQGETRKEITEKRLYLTEDNKHLYINLVFVYDDVEIKSGSRATQVFEEKTGTRIAIDRDWKEEQQSGNLLLQRRLIRTRLPGEFTPRRGISHLDWLYDELPEIIKDGYTCFGEDKLLSLKINRSAPTVSMNIYSGINWFDVDINIKFGRDNLPIQNFLKAVRDGRKYIQVNNGEFVKIPDHWFPKWKNFAGLLTNENKSLKLSPVHIPFIEELESIIDEVQGDKNYSKIKERINNINKIPEYKIPDLLMGNLRPYQVEGFRWLRFLYELGLGGVLADDMGLGKTIQALTFLIFLFKKKNTPPALIVMPASLIFNWVHEIKKFAPHFSFIEHTGMNRSEDISLIKNTEIILTTYGILRKDWPLFRQIRFSAIILDESQNIKNPLSISFKAVNKLQSEFRLALSGTPIENTTIDMWSQMSFANPGMLGKLSWFRKNYAIPIEKDGNMEKASQLQKILRPVVLRRTKEVVEKDLPPKIEHVVFCNMTPEQADFYNNIRDDYRDRLMREIDENGLNRSKLRVVEYLTRLRQASNHPRLLKAGLDIPSGKMNTLMNLVNDITSEGHKVLIFSQFVKMLGYVRQELVRENIRFSYLDGSTRNRESVVSDFQLDPKIQVFLISIKAGGTGLNLTAAEYVIQVDPWWNPAVENQATDRAHRIGQDKKVFVHKLITHGTVEEKILQLQERKKNITSNIISADAMLVKNLSRTDILELFDNE